MASIKAHLAVSLRLVQILVMLIALLWLLLVRINKTLFCKSPSPRKSGTSSIRAGEAELNICNTKLFY